MDKFRSYRVSAIECPDFILTVQFILYENNTIWTVQGVRFDGFRYSLW